MNLICNYVKTTRIVVFYSLTIGHAIKDALTSP